MGKAAKFFRSLLGSNKSQPDSSSTAAPLWETKKKSKWALSKSADFSKFKNEDPLASPYIDGLDANKHAIAVAAATAAVAEAALAAAHAAAEVVRLTSGGGSASDSGRNVPAYVRCERRRVAAAIMIQSAFRAYLARRALRALKGLVKLQALVRGHIVRKQSADMLRRMQAMARIQARASATRSYIKPRPSVGVAYHQWPDNAKLGGHVTKQSRSGSNWLNHWMEQYSWNNRQASSHDTSHGDDKILEIDTWKPRQSSRRPFPPEQPKLSSFSAKLLKPNPSISSEEVSLSPKEVDQVALWAAESSPRVHSASSRPTSNARGGAFTPTRSECSRSVLGDYLSHPSYMANTESSRAKVRSQSAPKQRMQLDELGVSRNGWESDAMSEKGYQQSSQLKRQGAHSRGALRSSYGYRF